MCGLFVIRARNNPKIVSLFVNLWRQLWSGLPLEIDARKGLSTVICTLRANSEWPMRAGFSGQRRPPNPRSDLLHLVHAELRISVCYTRANFSPGIYPNDRSETWNTGSKGPALALADFDLGILRVFHY